MFAPQDEKKPESSKVLSQQQAARLVQIAQSNFWYLILHVFGLLREIYLLLSVHLGLVILLISQR